MVVIGGGRLWGWASGFAGSAAALWLIDWLARMCSSDQYSYGELLQGKSGLWVEWGVLATTKSVCAAILAGSPIAKQIRSVLRWVWGLVSVFDSGPGLLVVSKFR